MKPAIEIRRATDDDAAAIAAIYNEAIEEHATAHLDPVSVDERRAWLARRDPERYPVLVAVGEDDAVWGWVALGAYRPGRGAVREAAEISYYVRRTRRRRGVADALVPAAIETAAAIGHRVLFAILLDDNRASVALLERHGFARWGRLPGVARFGDRVLGHLYFGRRVGEP